MTTEKLIAIVDDSKFFHTVIQRHLKDEHCSYLLYDSADAALHDEGCLLEANLIFVDYEMPGKNGIQMIEILRKKEAFKKTLIVGMSATLLTQQPFLNAGADDFILKEKLQRETLLNAVKAIPEKS